MSQHYTKNTVEASAWCRVCHKDTMHRVDEGQLGPCLVCMKKPTPEKPPPPPQSGDLF